jgi:AcrR family transcriptional regulator
MAAPPPRDASPAPPSGQPPATPVRPRKSAELRREEILAIAVRHFAEGGYRGTSTEAIAREAGISQPYLFRLFPTKRQLFLDCSDRACEHVAAVFRRVAAEVPAAQRLERMGRAYVEELLPERHEIQLLMQSYAAAADRDIQEHVRTRYGQLVEEVAALAEVEPGETFTFFAHGMLLNIVATLDLPAIAGSERWAAQWTAFKES